jgi:thiamine-monophosphate kinase
MTRKLGEFEIIKTYFAPLSQSEKGSFNLTDDAAVIDIPDGMSMVVTTDTLVEGVHFLSDDLPENIAKKLLRVSLSDLAAMGSVPAFYNLSIATKIGTTSDWFRAFAGGLLADQIQFGITLIGGDTVATSGPLTLSLTAMGFVAKGKAISRGGAKLGDDIWVSGLIGDAALGLRAATGKLSSISEENKKYLISRYTKPAPQTLLGPKLSNHVNSAIDISDGLVGDLDHICETSKLGADIQITDIPLSRAANILVTEKPDYIDLILSGGDDFELLFTADKSFRAVAKSLTEMLDVNLTKIGVMVCRRSIEIFDENGNKYVIKNNGYTHF